MKTALRVIFAAFGLAIPNASAATLYVAERWSGNVVAVDTSTGEAQVVASGLGEMIGITVDRKGRLFVSRFADGVVAQVDPVTGAFWDIAELQTPFAISADPDSDILYVGGRDSPVVHRISEVSPDTWTVDTAVSFDASLLPSHAFRNGNLLYVACQSRTGGQTGIWVKDLVTGNLRGMAVMDASFAQPTTMALESGGHLIAGDEGWVVRRIDPLSGQIVQTYSGFTSCCGVAVDPSDNSVYIAEQNAGSGRIVRLDLRSGERTVVSTSAVAPWQIAFAMPLRISSSVLSRNTLTLSWNGGPGIKLQKTSNLTTPHWQDVPNTDGHGLIALPLSDTAAFFRLIQP